MSKEFLSPLTVARLQAHEFSQLIGRTLKEIDSEPLSVDDKHVNKFILQLRQAQPIFQKSLDKVKASAMTEKIAQADLYRDQDLQALFDFAKPYKNSRIADEKDAYNSLAQLFKTYKTTKTANYEAETNQLNNLLESLEQSPYKEHIATLAIEKGVDRLKESQAAFEKLFAKRTDDARHKDVSNSKVLRQELEAPYQKLCDYVAFMAEHDEDEGYKALLNTLNNSRSYYANTLAKRSGKTKAKDEE